MIHCFICIGKMNRVDMLGLEYTNRSGVLDMGSVKSQETVCSEVSSHSNIYGVTTLKSQNIGFLHFGSVLEPAHFNRKFCFWVINYFADT